MENSIANSFFKQIELDQFLIDRYKLISYISKRNNKKVIKSLLKNTNKIIQNHQDGKLVESGLVNQILILEKLQGLEGIPKLYHHGKWAQGHYLQMQLLQSDFSDSKEYSLAEMNELAIKLLQIVRRVHDANILIQDIRPNNIMRSKDNNSVYIVNFSHSRTIPIRKKYTPAKSMIGSLRYASIRAHNMLQITKKDDLESLFYNIAIIYYGKLPWSKLNISPEHKMEKVKLLKVSHRQTLFVEMGHSFMRAFESISNLQPGEEPNYTQLLGYFKRHKTLFITPKISEQQKITIAKRLSYNQFNYKCVDNKKTKEIQNESQDPVPSINPIKNYPVKLKIYEQETNEMQELASISSDQQIKSIIYFKKELIFKNPFQIY